ncbi:MAG: hypothetical protein BSR46_08625 [Candidatus Dactylopiibacterium carminicum]|nr:MAG: hypothetical protein BSR46_08625 [Candidatus Dactylopiibacterium carminicum]
MVDESGSQEMLPKQAVDVMRKGLRYGAQNTPEVFQGDNADMLAAPCRTFIWLACPIGQT